MNSTIEKIVLNFDISGDFIEARAFGNGHINDTFLVLINQNGSEVKYILRKINKYVFKNPPIVVQNTVNVIKHISGKLLNRGVKNISNRVMRLIKHRDSQYYYLDTQGEYWCAVHFIEGAHTVEYVENSVQAYQAAKTFGQFQNQLIDANMEDYQDSIPNFHNLQNRLDSFDEALRDNRAGRRDRCAEEVEAVERHRFLADKITNLISKKELPIRITHNDTKINNVMLDNQTGRGQCVIDLDTVMPGSILYDFGDMVRTSTSPVGEDEKDTAKVQMRLNIFEALVKGYLEGLAGVLWKIETDNLVYGAKIITYEQFVRFITDYLNGDTYYSTKYVEHNLIRSRTQIALLESIIKQEEAMHSIVKKYLGS